jgi:phosphate transport system substrate-binding protein
MVGRNFRGIFNAALLLLLGPCLNTGAFANLIKVDGSSTVFSITEAAAKEFNRSNKQSKIMIGVSGTGGGFNKFCRGDIDIVNASRPISTKEMAECKKAGIEYIELPVAIDALTVIVNPKNSWASSLTTNDLRLMWEPAAQGKITKWQQINAKFPNSPLLLYGPDIESGTFDYFTEIVNGKVGLSRSDYKPTEYDNETVNAIKNDVNAIGYLGFAFFEENKDKLKSVAISWKGNKPVSPSIQSILDGSYQPFSRPLLIYIKAESLKKLGVKEFGLFYMNNGARLAKQVKYVELPNAAYQNGAQRIINSIKGTAFDGKSQIGVSITELLARQPK